MCGGFAVLLQPGWRFRPDLLFLDAVAPQRLPRSLRSLHVIMACSLSSAIHRAEAEAAEARLAVAKAKRARDKLLISNNDLTSLLINSALSDDSDYLPMEESTSIPSLLGHLRDPLDQRLPWYRNVRSYSRRELLADALVHALGLTLGVVAMLATIIGAVRQWLAVWQYSSSPPLVVATCIFVYGISLLTMLLCSALYNVGQKFWRSHVSLLALLDHIGICFLIAGSATPVMVFSCSWKGPAVLWALMILTMVAKAVGGCLDNIWLHVASFVLGPSLACWMAWEPMQRALRPWQLDFIWAAGAFYVGGLFPWGIRDLEFHVAIWHVCVILGSASIFAIVYYAVDTPDKVAELEATLSQCFRDDVYG